MDENNPRAAPATIRTGTAENSTVNHFKRIALALLLLLVLAVMAGAAVTAKIPGPNAVQAQRVSAAVLKLPVGLSKAQIAAFLAQEKLHFNYYGGEDEIDYSSEVMFNGYTSADLSGYCMATIRGTTSGLLVSGDVQYYFFFDKKGKLLKATVKEVWNGP